MKTELEMPDAMINRAGAEPQFVGITWIDSKTPTAIPVERLEKPELTEIRRERARRKLLHKLVSPTLGNIALFGCLLGLFVLYWLSSLGQAIGLRKNKIAAWNKTRRLTCQLGLGLLLGAAVLAGCVGYVGPDDGAVVYGGPDIAVFGGGFHGHFHEWSHRGAVSRGWHR
jgi:hypothetical protein